MCLSTNMHCAKGLHAREHPHLHFCMQTLHANYQFVAPQQCLARCSETSASSAQPSLLQFNCALLAFLGKCLISAAFKGRAAQSKRHGSLVKHRAVWSRAGQSGQGATINNPADTHHSTDSRAESFRTGQLPAPFWQHTVSLPHLSSI